MSREACECSTPPSVETRAERQIGLAHQVFTPKTSGPWPRRTQHHPEQSSEPDAHGGGHDDHWACQKERASKVERQASDRSSSLQLVDRDRDQGLAQETPATDRVGDRQSDTLKPSAQHCGHSSEAHDRNDHIENRDPLVVLHQAKPPSEGQQPSSRDSGRERHHDFDSMSPIAKVAHASRVGGVDREPALRTTARYRAPQRLQTTAAAEMQGMHIACTRRIGGSGLGRSGFSAFHGDAFSSRFVRRELYRGRWIAEIPSLPGTMAYGATPEQARAHAQALALRVVAERLEHEEAGSEALTITFRAA